MNKMLRGLTFSALLALSLFASTSEAFAKDVKNGRETAWTDLADLPIVEDLLPLPPGGVTWETAPLDPIGTTWEE
jgi:hypothetical protein